VEVDRRVQEDERLTLAEYEAQKAARKARAAPAAAPEAFDPLVALAVLPRLMNDQVVQLMNGGLWTSTKALEGYMAFHHLFLALAREFPALASAAAARVAAFRAREAARVKQATPNLGEFLCVLAVTEVSWEEIAIPLLEEAFDRNALWVLKAHPELVLKADAAVRIRQSFAANTVSLKLLSFQAWFLRKVARPPHKSAADVLACYDRTKGVPAASLVDALQDHCKALGKMQSHADFFALTGLEPVPEALLAELLERNLANSARKWYHSGRAFKEQVSTRREKRENKRTEADTPWWENM
jgi:hypothetical protein